MIATDNRPERPPDVELTWLGQMDATVARVRSRGAAVDRAVIGTAPTAGLAVGTIALWYAARTGSWDDVVLAGFLTAICGRAAYADEDSLPSMTVRVARRVGHRTGVTAAAKACWTLLWRLVPSVLVAGLGALIADGWFASTVDKLPIPPLLTGGLLVAMGIEGVLRVAAYYLHAATVEMDGIYHRGEFDDVDVVHLEWVDDLGGPTIRWPVVRHLAAIHRAWVGPGGWQLIADDGRVIRVDAVHGDPGEACREAGRVVRWLCGWRPEWTATTVDGDPFIAARPGHVARGAIAQLAVVS